MSSRLQNAGLIGLLVLTMVVVGFALRSRPAPTSSAATGQSSSTAGTAPSVAPTASGSPSPSSPTSVMAAGSPIAFIGDSFAEGKGADPKDNRWTSVLSRGLKVKELNFGHAGTGYLRAGRAAACDGKPCPAFKDVVAQVVAAKPKIVIIEGGANDVGLPVAEVKAAVVETITALKSGLPEATINVVTPWWDMRPESKEFTDLVAAVKAAAEDAGAVYLDTGQPIAGKPDLMSGSEANNAGHKKLAEAVLSASTKAGPVPSTSSSS